MIDGVIITPLRRIADGRGEVITMLRSDEPHFISFGEIYFSTVYSGSVKGWHMHQKMNLNYAVPYGAIKFVLYDDRPESATQGEIQVIDLGLENHLLVTVPPMVWNGFQGVSVDTAIVANCASIPHDSNEIERKAPFDPSIPYDWGIKHR
jgi:dTDP-4-dehydrorhamnose 3,5-epimerase